MREKTKKALLIGGNVVAVIAIFTIITLHTYEEPSTEVIVKDDDLVESVTYSMEHPPKEYAAQYKKALMEIEESVAGKQQEGMEEMEIEDEPDSDLEDEANTDVVEIEDEGDEGNAQTQTWHPSSSKENSGPSNSGEQTTNRGSKSSSSNSSTPGNRYENSPVTDSNNESNGEEETKPGNTNDNIEESDKTKPDKPTKDPDEEKPDKPVEKPEEQDKPTAKPDKSCGNDEVKNDDGECIEKKGDSEQDDSE